MGKLFFVVFNFHISQLRGKHNQAVDALLQRLRVNALSIASHTNLSKMIGEYAINLDFKDVMFTIELGKIEEPFHVKDDNLLYGNRLCVTHNRCGKVMYETQVPSYLGHRGIQAMLKGAKMYFY